MENILIEWTEDFSVGCEVIDEQHKKLCCLVNDFYQAFINSSAKSVVQEIIKKMAAYTKYHFETEERFFEQYNYSETEQHKQEHNQFVQKVLEFSERYNEDDSMLTYDIMTFLKNWIAEHILVSDQKYRTEICEKL